jgi:tetratricopeptide (TPR) repeat protein
MSNGQKTCFVIMGFGEKTDFQSNPQRVLNLNKTYDNIIKPIVTEAGLSCVRADEIIHSTVIDKPMYENLFSADLVIADLSTSNANAIYELGVRHALRPRTTIVMAETNFSFPFDLNHLSILKYEHLGKEIGFDEVMRVRALLKEKIVELIDKPETDSPVFLFIPLLATAGEGREGVSGLLPAPMAPRSDDKSFAELMENFRNAKASVKQAADWAVPLELLKRLEAMQPEDPYILQQLALCTYKFERPDKKTALSEAEKILQRLAPETSSDAETVGLWGAIHKRLWELLADRNDLDEAIRAYARGFYIRNDYYNGINYAFMLNVRAALAAGDEALADRVLARRVREEVLVICDRLLNQAQNDRVLPQTSDDAFFIGASKVEALFGLGIKIEADRLKAEIVAKERDRLNTGGANKPSAIDEGNWKEQSLVEQLRKLDKLLPATHPAPQG